jgi:hypothetical protein
MNPIKNVRYNQSGDLMMTEEKIQCINWNHENLRKASEKYKFYHSLTRYGV